MVRPLTESRIVLASHNEGKLVELRELVAPFSVSVDSARDHDLPEPEETGTTFEENAELKARAAAEATGLPALADDSGLAVDALNGDPGIYSARWAGPDRDFVLAMRNVEEKLQQFSATVADKRGAHFVAVLCLAWPDGHVEFFRGEVNGRLVWPPRGSNGMGYDPMFQPEGFDRTFGEMPSEAKQELSHRARAFAKFATACLHA